MSNMFKFLHKAAKSVNFDLQSFDDIDNLIDRLQTYGQFRAANFIGDWADNMIVQENKEWEEADATGYAKTI